MSAKTAIVQTGRTGDLIHVLPCARDIALKEGKCAVVVSAEFASVLEGCSYVDPVIVSTGFTDTQPAIEQARQMFQCVLIGKVNERNETTNQCESFTEESYRQLGYLDQYNTLLLVFDLRDRERERKLLEMVSDGRPMILVNTSGKSSPYPYRKELMKLFPRTHNVVELDKIKAERIYDLLGLMDAAELLTTSDTATLHLAAASGVPVFNLIADKPTLWHGSKPRNNGILNLRYGESLKRMVELEKVPWKWKPKTWHVWSDYEMSGDALSRHLLAKSTWAETDWVTFPVRENERVLKDPMRELPFIKDLVNKAVNAAGPRDIIVLTNADSCLAPCITGSIADTLAFYDCAYSYRRDFDVLSKKKTVEEIAVGKRYAGSDLFAFTVKWWKENEPAFPDMVLGAEGWDWCLRELMRKGNYTGFTDLVYHQKHANEWEHRNDLPSQIHNRNLASDFLSRLGIAHRF